MYGIPLSGELPVLDGWPRTSLCRLGALPSPHCDILQQVFTGCKHPIGKWKTKSVI